MPNLGRNAIVGRDFLKQFNCRIYCNLDKLRINGWYVDMVEDAYLQSLSRLKQSVKIKPQSAQFCFGKLPSNFSSTGCSQLQIAGINQCFASKYPGIMFANTVKWTKLPLLLINNTNQDISLRNGSVVGRVDPVGQNQVSGFHEILQV